MKPGPSLTSSPREIPVRPRAFAPADSPAPVFFSASAGADPTLLIRLLDLHPEVHTHPQGLLLHDGPAGADSARTAVAEMADLATRHATMRVRRGSTTAVRFVGAEVELRDIAAPDRLALAFPDAPLVCLIGDGRQAVVRSRLASLAVSKSPQPPLPSQAHDAAARTFHIEGRGGPVPLFCPSSLRAEVTRWIASLRAPFRAVELLGERALLIRAEALQIDTSRTLSQICRWLGVTSDQGTLLAAADSTRALSASNSDAPPWQAVFTEADKALFKRMAGELLIELGYERSVTW